MDVAVVITVILFLARHLTQLFFDVRNTRRVKVHVLKCWAKGYYIWLLYAIIFCSCFYFGLGQRTLAWVGFFFVWFGCGLGITSLFCLGCSYSFEICLQQDFRLVTRGIYSLFRHPMRIGLAVEALGFVFLCGKPALLVPWAFIVALQVVRTKYEERFLVTHLGDAYLTYRKNTGLRHVFRVL